MHIKKKSFKGRVQKSTPYFYLWKQVHGSTVLTKCTDEGHHFRKRLNSGWMCLFEDVLLRAEWYSM